MSPYHAMGCNPAMMVDPLGMAYKPYDNGARPVNTADVPIPMWPVNTNARYELLDKIMNADQEAFHEWVKQQLIAEATGKEALAVLNALDHGLSLLGFESKSIGAALGRSMAPAGEERKNQGQNISNYFAAMFTEQMKPGYHTSEMESPDPQSKEYKNRYEEPNITVKQFTDHYSGKTEAEIIEGKAKYAGIEYGISIDPRYRYVLLENGKEIDMLHFFVVGRLGQFKGAMQELKQWWGGHPSGFDKSDMLSNKLGESFFKIYRSSIEKNPSGISGYIYQFLTNQNVLYPSPIVYPMHLPFPKD